MLLIGLLFVSLAGPYSSKCTVLSLSLDPKRNSRENVHTYKDYIAPMMTLTLQGKNNRSQTIICTDSDIFTSDHVI